MTLMKSAFFWIGRIIAAAFAVVMTLLIVGLLLGGFTRFGAEFAAEQIAGLISSENQQIRIEGPSPLLRRELTIDRITVADKEGVYAQVDDLSLQWSPLDLLSGRFTADRIFAETVSLLRPPEPSDTQQADDGAPFSLPIEIDVEELNLPRVEVGEAIAGRQANFGVTGSAQAIGSELQASLDMQQLSGGEARLRGDVAYAPDDNRLRLDVDFSEPQGGLLASMLQLPGDPALSLDIQGDGPISDWRGMIGAELDGQPTANLMVEHELLDNQQRRITIDGQGQFAELLPPQLREPFAGETEIDVSTVLDPSGAITIERGNLRSASLAVEASGRYDATGENTLSAIFRATGEPVSIQWTVGETPLSFALEDLSLELSGMASNASLTAALSLAQLQIPDTQLSDIEIALSSNGFDIADRSGPLTIKASAAQVRSTDPTLSQYLEAPVEIAADIMLKADSVEVLSLSLDSGRIDGQASGVYDLAQNSLSADFATTVSPTLLPEQLASRLENEVSIRGHIDYRPPRDIAISDLTILTDKGSISGEASLDANNEVNVNLEGELNDLSLLSENISGRANLSISASGPLDELEGEATVTVPEGQAAGYDIEDLTVTAQGTADPVNPRGDITLSGRLGGQPIEGSAELTTEDGQTRIPQIRLSNGENTVEGSLTLNDNFRPSGTINFDLPDIGPLAALAGQEISGDLSGEVRLSSTGENTSADIRAEGDQLSRDGLSISKPRLDISASNLAELSAEGSLTAEEIRSGETRIQDPTISLEQLAGNTAIDAEGLLDGVPIQLNTNLRQGDNGLEIDIDPFSTTIRGIPIQLNEPLNLTVSDGTATIPPTTLSVGTGEVTVSGTAGQSLDLNLQLNSVPASLASAFAPDIAPSGTISGSAEVTGTPAAPNVTYDLTWSEAQVAQTRSANLPPLTVTAEGSFQNNQLTIETNVSGSGLSLSGGGSISLANQRLDLQFDGVIPFQLLTSILAPQGLSLEGQAAVDLSVTGTTMNPQIRGQITTSESRLVDVRRNLALEGLNGSVNFTGTTAEISNLTGRLATGGTVSVNGTINLTGAGLPADIAIVLDNAVYVDGTTVTSRVNGNLTLTGPLLAGPLLAGTVNLDETSITIPERLPSSLAEIDIRHRNAPQAVRNQTTEVRPADGTQSNSPVRLDVRVSSPSQIFVRGRGIDAELGGALTLTGTVSSPIAVGAFELRRGRLQILTKRLQFTRGTITFAGSLVPRLDMEATTTSNSTTITITISGLANDPAIAFSSSPALPQDEILAELIFGQSLSRLSPLQIAQLADAAAQLAGGTSSSLFQALRSTLGVDDLDISTDETGQTTFSAGKYLNDRTYLELQQSGNGDSKAIINLDIGRGLKLKGEAGGRGAGAGIYYEKEY
ncbi:translocation/assembly module TamB [Peteryoungia desertarenae]|uniref:Translocation/assembly module TamB n=1 Tax=Peteryoungia desertarenae TaxID=1813451 RepID=A0ABX6QK13_9HYPH|nr:translocation/assembly module TamB domain-containing protein [Peteryoungia desertarenae]QLF68627.1 translocation/assembly module TamB [Peteryoungia desertarenae]